MLARTVHDRPTELTTRHTDAPGNLMLLTIRGDHAKVEGKFEIADSLEIQCEIGGELDVGGKLVIGERGTVKADVRTVDAVIMGTYEGNMVASGDVEIASTGKVSGNIKTDSLVIHKGGFFNGNVAKIDDREETARPTPARTPRPIRVAEKSEAEEDDDKAIPKLDRP